MALVDLNSDPMRASGVGRRAGVRGVSPAGEQELCHAHRRANTNHAYATRTKFLPRARKRGPVAAHAGVRALAHPSAWRIAFDAGMHLRFMLSARQGTPLATLTRCTGIDRAPKERLP